MVSTEEYPLKHSVILDLVSTISISNKRERLINARPATHDDYLWIGDRQLPITEYGTLLVGAGNIVLHLEDVAPFPPLLTTFVALQ